MMKFFKRLWRKIRGGADAFIDWFRAVVQPELFEFLNDNKDLAMEFALQAARKYANQPSHLKLESVQKELVEYFSDNHGRLRVDNQWINLLIEVAVAALKGQGKI